MKYTGQALEDALSRLRQQLLWRTRSQVRGRIPGRRACLVEGQELIDFSSNDYLGLAQHPALIKAMADSALSSGTGSGASHLVTGHGTQHGLLEEELASFTGRSRALLFSTGYMANLAVLTTFASRGERVLLDRLSHASLIDGARLSGARLLRYTHNDARAVRQLLHAHAHCTLIATDGLFSMDGDVAPVADLARLAHAHHAWFVVDDAHGLGVLGATGGGTLEAAGLTQDEVPLLVGTLGKAFGSFGAFVAGPDPVIELLMQRARSYIYTTALPEPVAAATRQALATLREESWRRERVLALVARLRAQLYGLPMTASVSPIQPVILASNRAVLSVQRRLQEAGFWVVAIRSPTVPKGAERLRITLSAAHTEDEVDRLATSLRRACAELDLQPQTANA